MRFAPSPRILLFLAAWVLPAMAQSNSNAAPPPFTGWDVYRLGDRFESVVSNLQSRHPWMEPTTDLNSDTPRDASQAQILIKANRYFTAAQFLFRKGRLYTLRLEFNPRLYSYLDLFKELKEKYGPPGVYTFRSQEWSSNQLLLILERDTTVKYIDLRDLASVQSNASVLAQGADLTREALLKGL
ncbi:MAG: hypothetical protein J0L75_09985 [Spirochaetes bacterium]|nr:hypothetical protein [Spirochaetota bacterium]